MSALQMSLFYVFTHSFTLWPEAYECPENIKTSGTRWPIFGTYLIISGALFLLLYTPCLIAIIRVKSFTPAYQLMLMIAILDIISLSVSSFIPGTIALTGITFCEYPLLFFFTGAVAVFAWMTVCVACILLAIERCVEVNPKFALHFLFGKRTFRFLMILLISYSVYTLIFGKPIFFNPDYSCYLFDPLIGKDPNLYPSYAHSINNSIVAVSTTTLYFYLCYYLICKYGYSTSMWLYKSKRQIILQGVILCFFHAAAAIINAYMQFFYVPQWLFQIAHLFYQLSTGCMSIVYLTLNRTIRNSVIKMIIPKKIRAKLGLHIGIDEHLALEKATDTVGTNGISANNANVVKIDNFFPN